MKVPKLFSKRNKAPVDKFSYSIPKNTRARIIYTLSQMMNQTTAYAYTRGDSVAMFAEVARRCLREYGGIRQDGNRVHSYSGDPDRDGARAATEHFELATDDEAIDFIEMIFQSNHYQLLQEGVDEVNNILREDGIGFELSQFIVHRTPVSGASKNPYTQTHHVEIEYPEAIKKTSDIMHTQVIMPALSLLSGAKWKVANEEMHDAHRAYREGRLDDANTACGRAFETVLKTICTEKKWQYDPNKAGAADLIKVCKDNNLFPGFYVPIFEGSGTVRNKLGGHGKGPQPLYQNDDAYVQHLIQQTSAHILLLAKLAGMA